MAQSLLTGPFEFGRGCLKGTRVLLDGGTNVERTKKDLLFDLGGSGFPEPCSEDVAHHSDQADHFRAVDLFRQNLEIGQCSQDSQNQVGDDGLARESWFRVFHVYSPHVEVIILHQ